MFLYSSIQFQIPQVLLRTRTHFGVVVSQNLAKMCIISSHRPPRTFRSKLNVGTLNIRGLNTDFKKDVANDMRKYQLSLMAIQETKLKTEGFNDITPENTKKNTIHITLTVNKINIMVWE